MPLTPERLRLLEAVRDARHVALAVVGNYEISLILDIVMDSITDGTEAELLAALTAVACGPVVPKRATGGGESRIET